MAYQQFPMKCTGKYDVPGQQIQVDAKAVPRHHTTDLEARPYLYTAMDK